MPGETVSTKAADAARLEHARRLAQASLEIAPVMRAEAAEHQVETSSIEGKAFGHTLLRRDIAETAFLRGPIHHIQHLGRQVICHDLPHMRRDMEGDMAAAAAEVEHAGVRMRPRQRRQRLEIDALRMHGAVQIGVRARAELAAHQCFVALASPAWLIAPICNRSYWSGLAAWQPPARSHGQYRFSHTALVRIFVFD